MKTYTCLEVLANATNLSATTTDKIKKLFDVPMTPSEVLSRTDGEWENVTDADRLRLVLETKNFVSDDQHVLYDQVCAHRCTEWLRKPQPSHLPVPVNAENYYVFSDAQTVSKIESPGEWLLRCESQFQMTTLHTILSAN